MSLTTQSPFKVTVSKDKLRAEIVVTDFSAEQINSDVIKTRLGELAVPVTEQVAARIDELVARVREGDRFTEPVLLAEGRPPVPGKPEAFKPLPDSKEQEPHDGEDAAFDNRKCRIHVVKAGEIVGEYIPATPSEPGLDVHGQPIKPKEPSFGRRLGANLKLGDDGRTVIATCDGKVQVTRYSVIVVDTVKVDGDVDYRSGNLEVPGDVLITGTVRSSFKVRSQKSVTIKGAVEAAEVEAGTDLTIAGGIVGGGAGRIRAGGEVQIKFAEEADIEAIGDVIVAKEMVNSRVSTKGTLLVSRGSIVGGSIWAREGIEAQSIGNETGVRTEIAAGVLVQRMLYPNSVLIFGDNIATITKARRGPVKIVSREVDHVQVIMIVDQVSGSNQILPSQPYQVAPKKPQNKACPTTNSPAPA